MGAVVYVFTGSLCVTAIFMLNPADARTNIELADDILDLTFSLRNDFTDAL
jgi:hypothetical protein